jgi:hypothetical protein
MLGKDLGWKREHEDTDSLVVIDSREREKEIISSRRNQEDRTVDRANGQENIMSTYPWNYREKWPLTRAERIRELDELFEHYGKTLQRSNVIAAKSWHSKFPGDQIVPCELIAFQNGKIVQESDISLENGVVWDEVSKGYY